MSRSTTAGILRAVVVPFLLTRAWLTLAGLLSSSWLPVSPGSELEWHFRTANALPAALTQWIRWDADWYLTIATIGYRSPLDAVVVDMRPALFPLLPALIRGATAMIGNPVIAGLLVSNVAAVVMLGLLYRLVLSDFDAHAARTVVWAYLAFPTGFFLSSVYTESLLLCALVVGWWALRRDHGWWCGAALGCAILARPTGILALPGYLWLAAVNRRERGIDVRRAARTGVIPLLALVGYGTFARAIFSDPLAAFRLQEGVRGPTGWPWLAFGRFWNEGPALHGWANSSLDATLAIAALAMVPLVFLRLGAGPGLIAFAFVVAPLTTGLISFSRLLLAAFPLFVATAVLPLRGFAARALIGVGLVLQTLLFCWFVSWRWVA